MRMVVRVFGNGMQQTVETFAIPFSPDGHVHVMVMNVFGSTGKQSVSGVDKKATLMVDAMVTRLTRTGFTLLDVDVYPDPSVKGVTGAPCYKAVFKVK